jgi:hypothetical protein
MASIREISTGTIPGVDRGPISSAKKNKHSYSSLNFPLDVMADRHLHFVKFNIINVGGTEFSPAATKVPPKRGLARASELKDQLLAGRSSSQIADFFGDTQAAGAAAAFPAGQSKFSSAPPPAPKPDALKDAKANKDSSVSKGRIDTMGDIILYIPHSVSESYSANWSGMAGGLGGQLFSGDQGIGDTLSSLAADFPDLVAEGLSKVVSGVSGNEAIAKAQMKSLGKAVNPHFQTFFDGVEPRSFQFDFKLSPRNLKEAETISAIIRMFKVHSAPRSIAESGAKSRYWEYPKVFQIEYWNAEQTHKIGNCALKQINVNYSGAGDNHTFSSNHPVQTDLSLTFQEMDLVTAGDFEKGF